MADLNQVKTGVLKYIDDEIMPHLDGTKKIGLGVYVALIADRLPEIVQKCENYPSIKMLDVIDGKGNIDIDRIYRAIAPMMKDGEKLLVSIPLIGDFRLDTADIEKIYRNIKGS